MKDFAGDFLGAFGDTGIFIPLALGMIIICGLSPTAVFLPAGLLYIVAGYYYKIPFPVQPLKAVAAIALVNALTARTHCCNSLSYVSVYGYHPTCSTCQNI